MCTWRYSGRISNLSWAKSKEPAPLRSLPSLWIPDQVRNDVEFSPFQPAYSSFRRRPESRPHHSRLARAGLRPARACSNRNAGETCSQIKSNAKPGCLREEVCSLTVSRRLVRRLLSAGRGSRSPISATRRGKPRLEFSETLFVVPCCARKAWGGHASRDDGVSVLNSLPGELTRELKRQRARNAPKSPCGRVLAAPGPREIRPAIYTKRLVPLFIHFSTLGRR